MLSKTTPKTGGLPDNPHPSQLDPRKIESGLAEDDESDDDEEKDSGMKLRDLQKSGHKDFLRKKEHWWYVHLEEEMSSLSVVLILSGKYGDPP